MKQKLTWKSAVQQKLIRKGLVQKAKANQMEEMASVREEFLREPIDEKFIALRLEAYYDIIKELLYAHAYKQGFAFISDALLPLYAHHHLHEFKKEIKKIEELFVMKSRIHSLGWKNIKSYLDKNEEMLNQIIKKLKEKLQ